MTDHVALLREKHGRSYRAPVRQINISAICKGFVASVNIADKFLYGQIQIAVVHLANLNLGTSIERMAQYFPPNLHVIVLPNDLISKFPSAITGQTRLQELYVVMSLREMRSNWSSRLSSSCAV